MSNPRKKQLPLTKRKLKHNQEYIEPEMKWKDKNTRGIFIEITLPKRFAAYPIRGCI